MTDETKLTMLKTMLFPDGIAEDEVERVDAQLGVYLDLARQEILNHKYEYSANGIPDELPSEYDVTQVMAVMQGFAQMGAEGQVTSIENGVHRHWKYADMCLYVHANVIPIAKVSV